MNNDNFNNWKENVPKEEAFSSVLRNIMYCDEFKSESKRHKFLLENDNKKITYLLDKNNYTINEKEQNDIFLCLYTRSSLQILELIRSLRPELFILSSSHFKYIIIYGRWKVLDFLLKNYIDLVDNVLKTINPYDIRDVDMYDVVVDCIWLGWSWYNDECDKPVINLSHTDFEKTFGILESLQEKYPLINFSEELKCFWLKTFVNLGVVYFIDTTILLNNFGITDLTKKSDIKKIANLIGMECTWELLNWKCLENLLE